MAKPLGKKRDKYRKMPLKTKIIFLKRVLEQGHSIKKVSADFKINYSTAKTLIRNQKLRKGKINLSQINYEVSSLDRQPTQNSEQMVVTASYKTIETQSICPWTVTNWQKYYKIQIISRISFPS